jgi:peptide/nickel transport system substrate-binding protein
MRFLKPSRLLCVFLALLAACQSNQPLPTGTLPAPTTAATGTLPANPLPTLTSAPSNTLVVCTQTEPQTLYIYGGSSSSMWSVLEAIYDGPFDTRGFAAQPVILEKIPSLADGDAVVRPVPVTAGDPVVDVNGSLAALQAGTQVLPSGCTRPDCAMAWDGSSELSMDQLVVTFKLRDGVSWSDGEPLSAADSVFSYSLAADPATPVSRYLTDRTFSYKELDPLTVEWTGLPGFYEQRFGTFFWLPLPEHLLGSQSAEALLSDPAASQAPLGWGPYVIEEWVAGDHITLRKNERYFRAAEGLPAFETLVYRFIGEAADGNLNALLAGECDVIDQNTQFLEMLPGLLEREAQQKLVTYVGQGPEWEHLDFGIRPAAYDDGYDPASGDRADLFGDSRVRQALAYCIDRDTIVENFLHRRSAVPNGYLPPSHPLYLEDLPAYAYNPDEGRRLLEAVGWKDSDGDPATPRVAAGVTNVPDGTPLAVTYQTTEAKLRLQVAQAAAAGLQACGVQVRLEFQNPGLLFGPGPDGPVFGRKFDLVQFSWEASPRPNCLLYASSQIPGGGNLWTGANVTGLTSQAFDSACAAAYWARPDNPDYAERSRQAQEQFAREAPVIPLYFYPKIAIARPQVCGLEMDVTARSILWNVEALRWGPCE